jgi:glycosyltransferase involved in cell wall biosynthesis
MHLIVLENEVTALRGGQELNLLEICRGLVQRGHQITLLYLKDGNLLEQYQSFCDRVINISAYGFDWRDLANVLQFVPSLVQLWQIPIATNSLIFCNDYHFSLFAYLLSSFRNLPFVCYLQLPPINLNRQRRFGLRGVDRYISVSHYTKQDWVLFGVSPDQIEVVHNGIDVSKFKPASDLQAVRQAWRISGNTRLISYIGRLDREKGLETLIQAIALLQHQRLDVQALIAGKPVVHQGATQEECEVAGRAYQRSLEQLSADLGVCDRVKFVGHLSNPIGLYQASDVSVLPSIWNEPCSLSLIESLACGVPKVASRIGGNSEILGDAFESMLFRPGDAQDLADRLVSIVHWREKDPQIGKRCRQYAVDRFSHETMIDGIESCLLNTIGNTKLKDS